MDWTGGYKLEHPFEQECPQVCSLAFVGTVVGHSQMYEQLMPLSARVFQGSQGVPAHFQLCK